MSFRFVGVLLVGSCACSTTLAQPYNSQNVDFLGRVTLDEMGAYQGFDVWGWTDALTQREYAVMGTDGGVSFIDVTDPTSPLNLGKLTSFAIDVKVYDNYAFTTGGDIFDLTRLRGVSTPQVFTADAFYPTLIAHNIAINEDSGFLYTNNGDIVDIRQPLSPVNVGRTPFWHDQMVANYHGPDVDYQGRQILFGSSGGSGRLVIQDVTDPAAVDTLAIASYERSDYTHQGWLSEDHQYFFLDDEFNFNWTHIFDVSDLESPEHVGFIPSHGGQDHNLLVKGNYIYAANYRAGLRVFEITDPANGILTEVAFLDTHPSAGFGFQGAWTAYPFFDSGTILVSDIQQGLVLARLNLVPEPMGIMLVLIGLLPLRRMYGSRD